MNGSLWLLDIVFVRHIYSTHGAIDVQLFEERPHLERTRVLVCLAVGYDAAISYGEPAPPRELAHFGGLPMAASITMAGLTGHVGLFPIYDEMREPQHFRHTHRVDTAAMGLPAAGAVAPSARGACLAWVSSRGRAL